MEQDKVLDTIRGMAPLAAEKMRQILADPRSSCYAKIQVISLILNRTYGMPESSVKISSQQETIESSIVHIRELVADLAPAEEEEMIPENETGRLPAGNEDKREEADGKHGRTEAPEDAAEASGTDRD